MQEKIKVGIIRCQQKEVYCPAYFTAGVVSSIPEWGPEYVQNIKEFLQGTMGAHGRFGFPFDIY